MRRAILLFLLAVAACNPFHRAPRFEPTTSKFPFATDSFSVQALRPGVFHYYLWSHDGPWAIHILEVNRDACYSVAAIKDAPGANGRTKTSALLQAYAKTHDVVAGVNGDFFSLATGAPTNAFVTRGHVVSGPNNWPVIAFDPKGAPYIATLKSEGSARLPSGLTVSLNGWNHRWPNGASWFDANWGTKTDTASHTIEVVLQFGRVQFVDTMAAAVSIPAGGGVLMVTGALADSLRPTLLSLHQGDAIAIAQSLVPAPEEAVGGRPAILKDSALTPDATAGPVNGFAKLRHPRTAVGIARAGRRLLFVVVDGRQKPYSDGMNLEELAKLFLALGARDAINLDGGGSTTMVLAGEPGSLYVANKPSDKEGERPVGNALAVVRGCTR